MKETYMKHLQGMVRIPTISNADESLVDFKTFEEFHKYLEEAYPLIHSKMKKEIIGSAGLLFSLKGTGSETGEQSEIPPILLMAHQDVVPEGNHDKWEEEPFGGRFDGEYIWGRGTTDCKNVILAQMEAVEELLLAGFEPKYDLYLAYGYNEEVHVPEKSAVKIVRTLKERGVTLGCVLDEGGDVFSGEKDGYDGRIGRISLAEKAAHDYEIYKETTGGHAMEPGKGTALGAVARAAVAIEANPLPYRLTELVEAQLKALSVCMQGERAEIYKNPREHLEALYALAKEDKSLDALLHTTFAITMASGSAQSNILPERASMIINCRVLQGDTGESVLEHLRNVIPEDVKVRRLVGADPEPATKAEGKAYELVGKVTKSIYGENTLMVPSLLGGATDSHYYAPICDHIFRFSGFLQDERWGKAHGANERIPADALESAVRFFKELLTEYGN